MTLIYSLSFALLNLLYAGPSVQMEESYKIPIKVELNNESIVLGKAHILDHKDTLIIHTFKFHLGVASLKNGLSNRNYHLIDLSKEGSLEILNLHPTEEKLFLSLGIDSVTNSTGVHGDDLDPTNGMYWSWQSGYINVKLEGSLNSKPFEYHLGGFKDCNNSFQNLDIDLNSKTKQIVVRLENFFRNVLESDVFQIMSPQPEAVNLSEILGQCFYIDGK